MDTANEEFIRLIAAFHTQGLRYIIVGGFAVNRYGFNRATSDLDIYVEDTPQNRQALVNALEEMGYGKLKPLLRVPMIAGYCEVMLDSGIYADLMSTLTGLLPEAFDEHFKMALVDDSAGVPVRFLSYNHLIANKQATGRPKDLEDIIQLERIRNSRPNDI